MGLDMYLSRKRSVSHNVTDFDPDTDQRIEGSVTFTEKWDLAYWRKHNRLHGYMEQLYSAQGGSGEFNCIPVILTAQDIDTLITSIKQRNLPKTEGFFFGADSYGEDQDRANYDIEVFEKALVWIERGWEIEYNSWW